MNDRIRKLADLTLRGELYNPPVLTEFSEQKAGMSIAEYDVQKICEYIANQEPKLTEYSTLTGFFSFNGSVVGDAFKRGGHRETGKLMSECYCKMKENLSTCEWQHATADYQKVLQKGIRGLIAEIDASAKVHEKPEELAFLAGMRRVAEALIGWAQKCSRRAAELAETVENAEHKSNLEKLSKALLRVPENPPQSFYEAVLTIYVCFSADPDSVGTLDRYLSRFYNADIQNGKLTREEVAAYLQELFLMLQSATPPKSANFTRGGESHFCIGGYLPNGTDGFCDLSRLIVESLIDLPTYIPQVTYRWTKISPREDLRFMMDCERRDPNKRIAFTNDEKRLKCYTEICGIPFEKAVSYTTVGCNEPAFLGAITGSNSKGNFLHCVETVFHRCQDEIRNCADFDAFYAVFEREMYADLEKIYAYDNSYNARRAGDDNYVSSLFFNDCIENARSLTKGGGNTVIASPMLLGITNVLDSVIAVKQFVYDEKLLTMAELIDALEANWQGEEYDDLRNVILKRGEFFGSDDERSNAVARRIYDSLYRFLKDKTNLFGYHWLVGDLLGYHPHHQWFGERTLATPDGRYNGDRLKFGISQSEGRDKNGLSALLNALAGLDEHAIACGATVTNITLDEQMMRNDEQFEKTVSLFETYFKNGGTHFQLTYVSKEDLIQAKVRPEDYKNLRVRVTGFADYFVKLPEGIQDDIIERTTQKS